MSYPDRRDAEPPLTLDDRRRAPRARGPAPVTLVVSLLLLVVVAGGVFFMYRSGVRGAGQAPQPLGAPLGDVRAPAPPQAQTPDAAAGLTISKDDPNAPARAPTLAPPPEEPLPEPATAAPAVGAARTFASTPAPGAAAVPPPVARTAEKGDPIDRLISEASKTKPPPAKPIAKDALDAKDAAKDAGGAAVVQIGAFSSETLADQEWSKAAAVAPGAMAGKGKRVVAVSKDGATLYRTAITGFASREQAQSLCDRLQAAGATCFVR
ncbi:MAG TPA: SPOR domain-containing protein [Caulobacteraceae bacterium]|nr:SPOR domain-containing protein [Caulobacteraceae bacterium]